jgi:hypothetical protein
MTTLMSCDDFKPCTNREPQQWDEGILVMNAVHVVVARLPDQRSGSFGTPKKSVQNDGFYSLAGLYLCRRPGTSSSRVGGNVRTDEPAAEPAESYFVDWSVLPSFQGSRNCRQKDFISDAEVFQALAYTPRILPGLPAESGGAESSCKKLGTSIGGV